MHHGLINYTEVLQETIVVTFDFICLTDRIISLKNLSEMKDFRCQSMSMVGYVWWMCIRPDLCKGQRFTAGLDTIITGSVDDILNL